MPIEFVVERPKLVVPLLFATALLATFSVYLGPACFVVVYQNYLIDLPLVVVQLPDPLVVPVPLVKQSRNFVERLVR